MYIVMGKDGCTYCKQAVSLLKQVGEEFKYLDLTEEPQIRFAFKALGHDTMPLIMCGERLVGGFQELQSELIEKLL